MIILNRSLDQTGMEDTEVISYTDFSSASSALLTI